MICNPIPVCASARPTHSIHPRRVPVALLRSHRIRLNTDNACLGSKRSEAPSRTLPPLSTSHPAGSRLRFASSPASHRRVAVRPQPPGHFPLFPSSTLPPFNSFTHPQARTLTPSGSDPNADRTPNTDCLFSRHPAESTGTRERVRTEYERVRREYTPRPYERSTKTRRFRTFRPESQSGRSQCDCSINRHVRSTRESGPRKRGNAGDCNRTQLRRKIPQSQRAGKLLSCQVAPENLQNRRCSATVRFSTRPERSRNQAAGACPS